MESTSNTLLLVRSRQGVGGEAGRVVHLARLDVGAQASGRMETLCEMSLAVVQVESVAPGVGMPCIPCLLHRDGVEPRPAPSAATYRAWGWPVTVRGDQVLLTLGFEVIALALPDGLAEAVTAILVGRDRPAPVLVDPGVPGKQMLLAGEPYGVPLPWPGSVRLLTGTVPLPPSVTPGGSVRWRHRPITADLAGCREIDVFGAVRTVLRAAEHAQGGSG